MVFRNDPYCCVTCEKDADDGGAAAPAPEPAPVIAPSECAPL